MIRNILKVVVFLILLSLAIVGNFLVYIVATDYRPDEKITLAVDNNSSKNLEPGQTITLATLNLGYGGLDAGEDFFLDGGKNSHAASLARVKVSVQTAAEVLHSLPADFILIQEVDKKAHRSFKFDEAAYLSLAFPDHASIFAINYKVPFIPAPITDPLGGVLSGLLTLSNYHVDSAARYQYKNAENWLRQLFELDRCFVELRMKAPGGKELVVINTHLSAYDKGGGTRALQLGYLHSHLITEYEKGNYVILGGDFNFNLPGTDPSIFPADEKCRNWEPDLPVDFTPPGFKWAVQTTIPTLRSTDRPYTPGKNCVAIIDGFLVSPNIDVISVQAKETGFAISDHQPVFASLRLK